MNATSERGLPPIGERTLVHAMARAMARYPDAVAHRDMASSYTFAQAERRALALAGGLHARGVTRGTCLLTMLDGSIDAIHTWLACGLTGIVEVPVNTAFKGEFLARMIRDCGATAILVDSAHLSVVESVLPRTKITTVIVRGEPARGTPKHSHLTWLTFDELLGAAPAESVGARPGDVMALMYTSGTTGESKGVRVTQAQLYTYASWEEQGLPETDECTLVTLPLFHFAGRGLGVYRSLIHGSSVACVEGFSVSRFWNQVAHFEATNTILMGSMLELLVARPPAPDDADNTLRWVHVGPLPSDVESFEQRFGVQAVTGYGMTEIGLVTVSAPGEHRPGGCGRSRPGFDLRVVDENDIEVPPGVQGELVVRATEPWLLADGYHDRPATTVETTRNLWFHTGDAFVVDDEGQYYFQDRLRDALRRRGENVSSREVETAICQHPSVDLAAVVAVPSELSEDEIKAVVVAAPGATVDPLGLLKFLADELPYFMVPRYVEVVERMPMTPTNKIRKHELRAAGVGAGTWDREAAGVVVRKGQFEFPGAATEKLESR